MTNFVDYAWSDAEELAEKTAIVKQIRKDNKDAYIDDIVSMIFYSEHGRYFSEIDGNLQLQHTVLKKDKTIVIDIMTKVFGKDFVWNGKDKKAMLIKLHKI